MNVSAYKGEPDPETAVDSIQTLPALAVLLTGPGKVKFGVRVTAYEGREDASCPIESLAMAKHASSNQHSL